MKSNNEATELMLELLALESQDIRKPLNHEEYEKTKELFAPVLELLKQYEKGISDKKAETAIGESFQYQGDTYEVQRHGSTLPYSKAYKIALSLLGEKEQEAVQETVEGLKKETKKVRKVESD